MRKAVWAIWPLTALLVASLFMTSFGGRFTILLDTLCITLGGLATWCLTGGFGFYDLKTETREFMYIGTPVAMTTCFCALFYLAYRVKKMIHGLSDDVTSALVLSNFQTLTYMIVPIIYLTLEGVGLLVGEKSDLDGLLYSVTDDAISNVINVNFRACMHIFGIAVVKIFFVPFSSDSFENILKGNVGRRMAIEIGLFAVATLTTMLALSTRSSGSSPTNRTFGYTRLVSSVIFLACWWAIFIMEGVNLVFYTQTFTKEKMELVVSRQLSRQLTRISEPNNSQHPPPLPADEDDESDPPDETTVTSNTDPSAAKVFFLGNMWRFMFGAVPLLIVPMIAIIWICTGDIVMTYVYLSLMPMNILCAFCIFFSSPGYLNTPLFEIITYLVGGPVILILGGIAEVRWGWESDPTEVTFVLAFRIVFSLMMLFSLGHFLRLRKVIAKYVPDIPVFVTNVVCGGAIRAMIPVAYVCFSSLGCIIEEGGADGVVDDSCVQEMCCNVGVALHLTGVCLYQPFMLRPFHNTTMQELLQFRLPLKDKVKVILLALSSSCSMSLFAWRSFDGWATPEHMFLVVGTDMLIIIVIWSYLFGAATKNVLKHEQSYGEESQDKKGGFTSGDENAVGLATGEMGLGGLAPGLV
jgi:hypothetical protein